VFAFNNFVDLYTHSLCIYLPLLKCKKSSCWQEPDEPDEEEENAEEDENSRLSAASSAAAATSAKKKKKEEKTSRSAVFSLARLSLKRHDDKMKRFQNVML
jgi:hypothetical protein